MHIFVKTPKWPKSSLLPGIIKNCEAVVLLKMRKDGVGASQMALGLHPLSQGPVGKSRTMLPSGSLQFNPRPGVFAKGCFSLSGPCPVPAPYRFTEAPWATPVFPQLLFSKTPRPSHSVSLDLPVPTCALFPQGAP